MIFASNDPVCDDMILINDNVVEGTETFVVSLSTTDPDVTFGAFPSAIISILDDDGINSTNSYNKFHTLHSFSCPGSVGLTYV